MFSRKHLGRLLRVAVLLLGVDCANGDAPSSLAFGREPQTWNECPLHAAAFVVGAPARSPRPIVNIGELRTLYEDLAKHLAVVDRRAGKGLSTTERLATAIDLATYGRVTLHREYVDGLPKFLERLAERTGPVIKPSGASVAHTEPLSPVLTLVTALGTERYPDGKLVAVLARVVNPDADPVHPDLLLVSPELRVGSVTVAGCALAGIGETTNYAPVLVRTSDYRLKSLDGKLLLMWVTVSGP